MTFIAALRIDRVDALLFMSQNDEESTLDLCIFGRGFIQDPQDFL